MCNNVRNEFKDKKCPKHLGKDREKAGLFFGRGCANLCGMTPTWASPASCAEFYLLHKVPPTSGSPGGGVDVGMPCRMGLLSGFGFLVTDPTKTLTGR